MAEILCRIYTGGTMPGVILKAEEKEAIRHGVFQAIGFASEEWWKGITVTWYFFFFFFFPTPALQST